MMREKKRALLEYFEETTKNGEKKTNKNKHLNITRQQFKVLQLASEPVETYVDT